MKVGIFKNSFCGIKCQRAFDLDYFFATTNIGIMVDMSTQTGFDLKQQREKLCRQLQLEGISDPRVLEAIGNVPREEFVPEDLTEFAYRNAPLPIGEGQTISQPFVVAYMAQLLELEAEDRVLEIGAGSGYAAAILAKLASEVYAVERHRELATSAQQRLHRLGFDNVQILHGDGTQGWPEHAPYDAIVVAAGGPEVPPSLRKQLAIGGRLVIPVGSETSQRLIRVRRVTEEEFEEEELDSVVFVPLIGAEGWKREERERTRRSREYPTAPGSLGTLVQESAEPIAQIDGGDFGPLLKRIGDARVVLIGEATHGTSEFYRMRAEITKVLIQDHGFNFVAVEADWPDAARINDYVTRRQSREERKWEAFSRFPTWMWRNHEVLSFLEWQREFNLKKPDPLQRSGFYGLDLYNMYGSIEAVLDYLDRVDPAAARIARERYGCLTPWEHDPATYGRAALSGRYRDCEGEVVDMLRDLLKRQAEYSQYDGEQFLDASMNARLIAGAERYYRVMYYGSVESWNHRDQHMFETLQSLLEFHGPDSKAVVWAHNSHLGDASATEMGARGEHNIGQLCREAFADAAYLIGQATHFGTVAAASHWGSEMEIKNVRPSLPESYERICHESKREAFFLPLREPQREELREALSSQRLQRAIGVIYRPDTERQSHYFRASLPRQFDELIWFNRTEAVRAIVPQEAAVHPPAHPFAVID